MGQRQVAVVSIHSPRVRGDGGLFVVFGADGSFYPLPSGEGRQGLISAFYRQHTKCFYPLPSGEGRPLVFGQMNEAPEFLSTPLG